MEDITVRLYNEEKNWIQNVRNILVELIPEIQNIVKRMSKYTYKHPCEYSAGDRCAWISQDILNIQTQNFKFIIIDDDIDFIIQYEILDEYACEHIGRIFGIDITDYIIQIFKINNQTLHYVNYNNYYIFEYFIAEIVTLSTHLDYVTK